MKAIQCIKGSLQQVTTHLSYTPILASAALLSLLRIGLYAKLLDLGEFGTLSKLLLISGLFCAVGSFGFQLLAQRDLPSFLAIGRDRKSLISLSKAVIVTTATALLCSFAVLFGISMLDISSVAFLCALMHGWTQQIFMLATIDTRSRLEMTRYSKQIFLRTVLCSLAAVCVAWIGGGAVQVIVAELVVTLVLSARFIRALLSSTTLSVASLGKLAFKGFKWADWQVSTVLFLGSTLGFFSSSVDRWLAADFLTGNDFGLYSFAWIALTAALSIQSLLNAGIFPLISRKVVSGVYANALRITIVISLGLLLMGILAALLASILAETFITKWYPQYINALPLLPPLLLAAVFRVSDFWSSYLIIVHRQNLLLKIQVSLIGVPFLYYCFEFSGYSALKSPHDFALLALFLSVGNYIANGFFAFGTSKKGVQQ